MRKITAFILLMATLLFVGCSGKEELNITDKETPVTVKQLELMEYDPDYTFVNSFDGRYVCFIVARPVREQTPEGVSMETGHVIVYDTETEKVEKQFDLNLNHCFVSDTAYKDGCLYYVVSGRENEYEILYSTDGQTVNKLHSVLYNDLDELCIDVVKDDNEDIVFVSKHQQSADNETGVREVLQIGCINRENREIMFKYTSAGTTSDIFGLNAHKLNNLEEYSPEYMQVGRAHSGAMIQQIKAFNPDSNVNGVGLTAEIPMSSIEFVYVVGNDVYYYDYAQKGELTGPMDLNVYNLESKTQVKLAEYEAMKKGTSWYGNDLFVYSNVEGGRIYVMKHEEDSLSRSYIENTFYDKKINVLTANGKVLIVAGMFTSQPDELYIASIE